MVRLICIYIMMYIGTTAWAQSSTEDKELASLVDVVKMLRVAGEKNYNKGIELLQADYKWTPMDETGNIRDGVECRATEGVPSFRLNRIMSRVAGSRRYESTHGDMINGENTDYDYSLYERALKPDAEVSYELKGREGRQTFVIVPYNKSATMEAYIESDDVRITGDRKPDGCIVISWTTNLPTLSHVFQLVVRNGMPSSQSFVIINHNTRTK